MPNMGTIEGKNPPPRGRKSVKCSSDMLFNITIHTVTHFSSMVIRNKQIVIDPGPHITDYRNFTQVIISNNSNLQLGSRLLATSDI